MSSDEQQTSSLTNRGDDTSSDLIVTVANTHPNSNSNNASTESRIANLLGILQGTPTKESWDAALIEKVEQGDLKGYWKLSIQDSDWGPLIHGGFTWAQLRNFLLAQYSAPVIIGPLCLSRWGGRASRHFHSPITINEISIYRFKDRNTDAEIERAFAGFTKLLHASGEVHNCGLYSDPTTWKCILGNDECLRNIYFWNVRRISPHIFQHCFASVQLGGLELYNCSFVDRGVSFCEWLVHRKHPINTLDLEKVDIDGSILASALRSTACVNKLLIQRYGYQNSEWDALIDAISEMRSLESIDLRGDFKTDCKWMEWLFTLMTNASLQVIGCTLLSKTSPSVDCSLDQNKMKENTENICAMLKERPQVRDLRLPTSWIDTRMWKAHVKPILVNRQAPHLACMFEGATVEDAASKLGCMLRPDGDEKFDVNAVFQLLLHSSTAIKAVWDTGLEIRMMALDRKI